jgi:hypothetical protein
MRLTLIQDGNIGAPVAEQGISDHPDKGELQDALDEIGEAAQQKLVVEAEAAAKQYQEDVDAEREATNPTPEPTTSSTRTASTSKS